MMHRQRVLESTMLYSIGRLLERTKAGGLLFLGRFRASHRRNIATSSYTLWPNRQLVSLQLP